MLVICGSTKIIFVKTHLPNTIGADVDTESVIQNKTQKVKKANANIDQDSSLTETAKIKLLLATEPEHPLSVFQNELKIRGIKNLDINNFVVHALNQVPKEWWQEQLEDLTPLEYRVNNALSDPKLRQKLSELLTPQRTN